MAAIKTHTATGGGRRKKNTCDTTQPKVINKRFMSTREHRLIKKIFASEKQGRMAETKARILPE